MALVPLLDTADAARPLLLAQGRIVPVGEFSRDVLRLAACLPAGEHLVNLCERRQQFLRAYCAALVRRQSNLMPPSRAPEVVAELLAAHPGSYRCDDEFVERALSAVPGAAGEPADPRSLGIPEAHVAERAFTSGTTGTPRAHVKGWGSLLASTRLNAARIRECLAAHGAARPWLVATVPPQHMYGTETSVLLPLLADMAVHAGRPLFPADVAAALAEVPEPRVLVTTPVHLRTLVASAQHFPSVALVLSATAPLDTELAREVETRLGTRLLEMFGSTETCVIATRRTALGQAWHLYPRVRLEPQRDGTRVEAPWFDAPTTLQDVIELEGEDHFRVRGRSLDMVEVAGKRASLADLTRRLLAVPGVLDAVVFQPEGPRAGVAGVRRVAALAVAPGCTVDAISRQLAHSIDAAFMPRPLVLVEALPRNELGKLAREQLLAALHPPT